MSPLTVLTIVVCLGAYTYASSSNSGECPQVCSCLGMHVPPHDEHKITTAFCWRSGLTTVPDFDYMDSLRTLHLEDNDIATLYAHSFGNVQNVERIYLQNNKISDLPIGVFDNLRSLQTLYLQSNTINDLPHGIFDDLRSLQTLRLDENNIATLPAGVFKNFERLQHFNITNNNIQYIPYGLIQANFRNLTIYAQGNHISQGSYCMNVIDFPRLEPADDPTESNFHAQCSQLNSQPSCVPDVNNNIAFRCGCPLTPVPIVPNGKLSITDARIGSKAFITCADGYAPFQSSITCQFDQTWTNLNSSTCERCPLTPVPKVPNGRLNITDAHIGAEAFITCNTGYERVQDGITCQLDQTWTNLISSPCRRKSCPLTTAPTVPNGKLNITDARIGSEAFITCSTGYVRVQSSIKCQSDQTWTNLISSPCQKEIDVQTLTSNTTIGGIVLTYMKYNDTVLPAAAKCPQTMRGREVCKDQLANGTWYASCSRYCQPKRCGYTHTFKLDVFGKTMCLDTLKHIAGKIWVFAYISHDDSAVNICIRNVHGVHQHLLSQDDFYAAHRHNNIRAAINQFDSAIFRFYISKGNGSQDLQNYPNRAQRPAAILCYDSCLRIEAGSSVGGVDEYGYYYCKNNKVPIVPHARAACRNQMWYGDCIDPSAELDKNVDTIWSSGVYNCSGGLVPAHRNCISSPRADGSFDAECINGTEFFRRTNSSPRPCAAPAMISP